tara:strand:+ start:23881 stop:24567 length:687 start_codon:yes stop_codon:yes gene_type:complete
MKKLILYSLLFVMVSCSSENDRSVKLNVNHTVQIPVEFVTVTVTISEYGTDPVNVELMGYENLARVVGLLTENGLHEDDLEIDAGQVTAVYYRRDDPYEFNSKVTFDITDTDRIDTFRRAIVAVGGTSFEISSFGNSDEDAIYDEAYRNAINSARDRAEKLLSNQSEKVGRILNLQEDFRHTVEMAQASRSDNLMVMNETDTMEPVDPMFRKEFYTKVIQFYIEFELI